MNHMDSTLNSEEYSSYVCPNLLSLIDGTILILFMVRC